MFSFSSQGVILASVLWFRRDLRVSDNPLLSQFSSSEVLPLFIFDTNILSKLDADDKRVAFIFESVLRLRGELRKIGLDLAIFFGEPNDVFRTLAQNITIEEILASTDNDWYAKQRDLKIASRYNLKTFSDSFLINASMGLKKDGTPYKVFTPFYNAILPFVELLAENRYEVKKAKLVNYTFGYILDKNLTKLEISLKSIGFKTTDISHVPFKENPKELLQSYKDSLSRYKQTRDDISIETSGIGIHLRFGTLGIREVFRELFGYSREGIDTKEYIRELIWREFYNKLLIHFPKSQFENFYPLDIEWDNNQEKFSHWCDGTTGIPIVDASMRKLNTTGYMHNRLRMIVSSFLTKNLHINWTFGEQYFAKKLLDYEVSSNVGSWQWASSTGADSVPYFRIFNPYLQTKKFDKNGDFITQWVEEYRMIAPAKLYDEAYLFENGDSFYKKPIVNYKDSAKRWLEIVNR